MPDEERRWFSNNRAGILPMAALVVGLLQLWAQVRPKDALWQMIGHASVGTVLSVVFFALWLLQNVRWYQLDRENRNKQKEELAALGLALQEHRANREQEVKGLQEAFARALATLQEQNDKLQRRIDAAP